MYREQIRLFLIFIVLAVLQVLIANHIHLFHFATPLLYVYLPLVMRRGALRWAMLLWAFSMGLLMDTFNNTPGVASGSMTLVALLHTLGGDDGAETVRLLHHHLHRALLRGVLYTRALQLFQFLGVGRLRAGQYGHHVGAHTGCGEREKEKRLNRILQPACLNNGLNLYRK